jgi:hypothetical protein
MSARLSRSEKSSMTLAYVNGSTLREIGLLLRRSKTTVANVLRKNGIDRRKAKPRIPPVGNLNPRWKGGSYLDTGGYIHAWTPNGHILQHRLIAKAPPGTIVHHKDGDRTNNAPENLQILSSHADHRKEHAREERRRYGKARGPTPMPGEKNPKHKISTQQALQVLVRHRNGESNASIARSFGLSRQAIRFIVIGQTWKHLQQFPEGLCPAK